MSSNNSVPGMIYPQQKPMLAGNPKDSAIAANNQSISRQSDLIKATSGGKRRRLYKKYGGATSDGVTVPQMQVQYSTTGAGGQDPNSIIKQNTSVSVQGAENAKYDNLAKKGGSRKKEGEILIGRGDVIVGGERKLESKVIKENNIKNEEHVVINNLLNNFW